ncbi:MAG: 2-oxoisovalerate dehydrogenase [Acidobacteria bacterium]|nr:2-oxoisovalerate dehydrogenase [Acidobacteriota bacterium]
MEELIFLVNEATEGGYIARALGESIFTEADDLDGLREMIRDAVRCHFDEGQGPRVIRLHYVREEVFVA